MTLTYSRAVLFASASMLAVTPWAANAQRDVPQTVTTITAEDLKAANSEADVVVTGTLLRGVAPVGTNLIDVNAEEITATGATSTNDMLATIPQVGTFNDPPLISAGVNAQSTNNRPRLRNLGSAFAGGSATLILMDGHRIVGSGIRQTTPDPDVIPPSVIERVEVIPDGGSSIYGSDAVAGVINFITKRRFSGLEVEGRYGFGDDYTKVDAFVTAGHAWENGSAYISYNYAWNDDILGGDRDYIQRLNWTTGQKADLNCSPGNITIRPVSGSPITYALPDRLPGTLNRCDESDLASFWPEIRRHSVFAGVSQDVGPVRFDLRGFYTNRLSRSTAGPFKTANASITPVNPFYIDIPGAATSGRPQIVAFNWEPAYGPRAAVDDSTLDTWGITPTASIDIDDNWQARLLFNYGQSTTTLENTGLNTVLLGTALAGTTTQTAINPYDIASTPNKALLDSIANWMSYGEAKQEQINARAIIDGTLVSLPGGDVRVAVGGEYLHESFDSRSGSGVPGFEDNLKFIGASREIFSAFGELYLPIFGPENGGPGYETLGIAVSGRYDSYNDVGDTFNPKIGVTYKPLEWLTFRGNWGTSYQAPGLSDSTAAVNTLSIIPFPIIPNPFQPPVAGDQPYLAIQGGNPGLRAQTADTWSIGGEIRPPFVPGLSASLTYYNIDFKDLVDIPPIGQAQNFFKYYTDNFIMNPTEAEVEALVAGIPGASAQLAGADLYGPGKPEVYALVDIRRTNLSRVKLDGLDFAVNYVTDVSFGSIDFSFTGNYQLNRKTQPVVTLPFTDDLRVGTSRFATVTRLGTTIGKFRAQATWYRNAGYDLDPIAANDFQDRVGSFNLVDLFLKYDVQGSGWAQDLSFTLNVNNVFDQDPPLWKTFDFTTSGFNNGFTLGRVVMFGARKKF
jgi:iron complex outermembrane receptor protein